MKYGAHIFLWIERWDNSQLGLFERARKLGLDVLEIAVGDDVEFDAAQVKQAAESTGMELVISPGGIWPMQADLSLDDLAVAKYAMDWHKHWIDEGAKAGAIAYTGALYGHPGRVVKEAPSQKEFGTVCKNLNELASYAQNKGVKIVLEPMSHFRTHFINNTDQALALLNATNHPNLMVLFDTYHVVTEMRDFYSGIKKMEGKLWGLHACENDRGCPGNGLIPWSDVFRGLKEINFDGYMVLESYNSGIRGGEFAYSRGMFHHVCDDGDDFVKKGTDFLKSF
jgi:D-psicose/D-tagatose/L-ribulose 3-epimerase